MSSPLQANAWFEDSRLNEAYAVTFRSQGNWTASGIVPRGNAGTTDFARFVN